MLIFWFKKKLSFFSALANNFGLQILLVEEKSYNGLINGQVIKRLKVCVFRVEQNMVLTSASRHGKGKLRADSH